MRNKVYIYVISAIFILLFVWCPISFVLDKTGVIELEDLANYKDPEKLYYYDYAEKTVKVKPFFSEEDLLDEDFFQTPRETETDEAGGKIPFFSNLYIKTLNAIEQGKAGLDNIYTNHLPYYGDILNFVNSNDSRIQGEFVVMLYNMENKSDNKTASNITPPPTATTEPTIEPTAEPTIQPSATPVQTSQPTTEPTTEPIIEPIIEPTKQPTAEPSPTAEPTIQPSATPVQTSQPTTEPAIEPTIEPTKQPTAKPSPTPAPKNDYSGLSFIASKIRDAGMFRVYQVRSTDNSVGFLDISMAMTHATAKQNMLTELAHVNRIAAASKDVNFFVYIGTTMQSTDYYNDIVPAAYEPSTKDILDEFLAGLVGVDGVACLDIDTFEERMERIWKTDHHWNAYGAYQGYTEIVEMMSAVIPGFGEPYPLIEIKEFPDIQYRGTGAARTSTPTYYDIFSVPIIDLPVAHPTERVTNLLDTYLRGAYDKGLYKAHYEAFYSRPNVITYPSNNTGRKLLLLGDSYAYWVLEPIAAHFDKTYVHYTLSGNTLDYNKFIEDNGITDVLLLQYGARTLSKATSATVYLEQILTR